MNTFYISPIVSSSNNSKETPEENKEHQVRIYRFWAYDEKNDLPLESAYFLKMIQIINFNNPVHNNDKFMAFARKSERYPKDGYNSISNYLFHSE